MAVLGDWGVDVDNNRVWANIDHASTYAKAPVPEPATLRACDFFARFFGTRAL